MAKLGQENYPLLYPIDSLLCDDDWGYLFSYSFQSPEKLPSEKEADSKNGQTKYKDENSSSVNSVEAFDLGLQPDT